MSNIEENKKLVEEYPFLEPTDAFGNKLKDYNYEFTHLDEMPKGWKQKFGIQMCEEIKQKLLDLGEIRTNDPDDASDTKFAPAIDLYQVLEVKEKNGVLCWYHNLAFRELLDIDNKYVNMSKDTCVICGNKAEYDTMGAWVLPFCSDCANKKLERFNEIRKKIHMANEIEEQFKAKEFNDFFISHESYEDFNY